MQNHNEPKPIRGADRVAQYPGDKAFMLHWLGTGGDERVVGRDIADAVSRAGYGGGALRALDYWEPIVGKKGKS